MLHMVTLRHGPETCPASHPELQDRCGVSLMRLKEGTPEREIVVRWFWANPAEHVFFAVVDAPSAHAITELTMELELFHWSTVEVQPVSEM